MQPLKKIVVIGPESTGKSTLCEGLAAHYDTDWVPEYAREYLLANGMDYRYEDLLTIAKGQVALEEAKAEMVMRKPGAGAGMRGAAGAGTNEAAGDAGVTDMVGAVRMGRRGNTDDESGEGMRRVPGAPLLFVDTDLYVMKVWSEFVFGRCDPWILEQIAIRRYDAYLLCRTDLPWVKDALREYPDLVNREKLFHIYRDCLVNQSTPWAEIGGSAGERLGVAIAAVERLIG
jgi:nicotinamide riboside kinase